LLVNPTTIDSFGLLLEQTVSDTLRYQLFKGDLDKELSLTTIGLQKNNQISSTISSLAGGVGEVSLYIFIK